MTLTIQSTVLIRAFAISSLTLVFLSGGVLGSESSEPLRLAVAISGDKVVMTWTTVGATLETASDIQGPWRRVSGAASPAVIGVSNHAAFFRLTSSDLLLESLYLAPTFSNVIGDPSGSCGCAAPESASSVNAAAHPQDTLYRSIFLHTGELVQQRTDSSIPSVGFDSEFIRTYRSGMKYNGPLGYGWDFTSNRRLVMETNGNVRRIDGRGRSDRFTLVGDQLVAPNGLYMRLMRNAENMFLERDPHGNLSEYSAPNSLGVARLNWVRDRNENQMTFQYNAHGQLTNTTDTLGRSMVYEYDSGGRIVRLSDHAGRITQFSYVNGYLASVTGPPVINTPNGNDFPAGKTEQYTYDANGRLIEITAPNEVARGGPPRLLAQYESNPSSPNFERLLSVRLGGTNSTGIAAGGIVFLGYSVLATLPTDDPAAAVFQTTVTNRKGFVTEYTFNSLGNSLLTRQFTQGIRSGDPAFYPTVREFNRDGQLIRQLNPEGDSIEFSFDQSNPDRLQQGNLLRVRRLPGPRGGDQVEIVTSHTYETNFNFIATSMDGRGSITRHFYDTRGNRIRTLHRIASISEDFEYNLFGQTTAHILPENGNGHRRRDVMVYYESGPQKGYLKSRIIDSGGMDITTSFEYDRGGNVIRTVDPNGNDIINVVNSLNQIVRRLSPALSTSSGLIRYQTDVFYDANNNPVRTEVENRDETGAIVASHPSFTGTSSYDILDNLVAVTQEAGPGHEIRTEYRYDANQKQTLTLFGEATAGRQPNNAVRTIYDERDLPYRETRGPGSPDQSTTQSDYNSNGELVRSTNGIEDSGPSRLTIYTYDGYGRLAAVADAMGNTTKTRFDPNGNSTEVASFGELIDVPGQAGNIRLSQITFAFDLMDRATRRDEAFFDTQTQTNIADGFATTTTVYAPNSQVTAVIDDNGHEWFNSFNTANRLQAVTDAKGNSVLYRYDLNGNTTQIMEIEKSDLGDPDQRFTRTRIFDTVNRLIKEFDNQANTVQSSYDSRGNLVQVIDGRGNAIRYDFDGLNRLIATVRDMDGNGTVNAAPGDGNPDIINVQRWDDSSRRVSQADDNGHTTQYAYDSLDRLIITQEADGTLHQIGSGGAWTLGKTQPDLSAFVSGYDVHGNIRWSVDANGTRMDSLYDLADRVTTNVFKRAAGIDGTILENFRYDGRSRIVFAQNEDSAITFHYNSLSEVTSEEQNIPGMSSVAVQKTYDALGNQIRLAYPGGRIIVRQFNELNKPVKVDDETAGPHSPIAAYSYIGPSRCQQRDYGNGTSTFFAYNGADGSANEKGDFGVKRIQSIVQYSRPLSRAIGQHGYTWDRNGNLSEFREPVSGDKRLYTHDAANHLTGSTYVTDHLTNHYTLDGEGNRITVHSNGDPGVYTCNSSMPEPADCQMNRYSATPRDTRYYDRNGNLVTVVSTNGDSRTLIYDARNRLVKVMDSQTGSVAHYQYDAFGRRVLKVTTGAITRFIYAGGTLIEERDGMGTVIATYAWSTGSASLLQMQRGSESFWFHEDSRKSIVTLTDASGGIADEYRYGDYGTPISPPDEISTGNPFGFKGMYVDEETGFCWSGKWNFDSGVGRPINGGGGDKKDPRDEPPPVLYGEEIDYQLACRVKIQWHWAAAIDDEGLFSGVGPGMLLQQKHFGVFTRISDDPAPRLGHHIQGKGLIGTKSGVLVQEGFLSDEGFREIWADYIDLYDSATEQPYKSEEEICAMARCLRRESAAYGALGPRPYTTLADYTMIFLTERHPNSSSFVGAIVEACGVPCARPRDTVSFEYVDHSIGWHYWKRARDRGKGDWKHLHSAAPGAWILKKF